jgi:hypothetical protein
VEDAASLPDFRLLLYHRFFRMSRSGRSSIAILGVRVSGARVKSKWLHLGHQLHSVPRIQTMA